MPYKCISSKQMASKDIGHKIFFANKLYLITCIEYSIPRRLRHKFPESEYTYCKLKPLTKSKTL